MNKRDEIYMKYLSLHEKAIKNDDPFGEFCEYCGTSASRDKNGRCKKCGASIRNPHGYCFGIPVYDADDAKVLGINA